MKSFIYIAVLFLLSSFFLYGMDDKELPENAEIAQLIADLGADDFDTREQADVALRKLGQEAVPYLEQALTNDDPERVMRSRKILEEMKKPQTTVKPVHPSGRNWTRNMFSGGMSLRIEPDKVVLELKDGDKVNRYEADSMEEFVKKYPEVAQQYGLNEKSNRSVFSLTLRSGGGQQKRESDEDFLKKFHELEKEMDQRFDMKSMERMFEEMKERQRELMDEFDSLSLKPVIPPAQDPAPTPDEGSNDWKAFGVRVVPLTDIIKTQLRLEANHKGVVVSEVHPNSPAWKFGLGVHDIILKMNDEDVGGVELFKTQTHQLLKKGMDQAVIQIIRKGKLQDLSSQGK